VAWSKLKSLFIVSDGNTGAGGQSISSDDAAAVDASIARYQVPPDAPPVALPPETDPATLTGSLDFQAMYDTAGIPNTDEVEALEKFLNELDAELPQASKLAAAKAFLKATGKSSVDVLEDAARKIRVVRAIEAGKREDSRKTLATQQQAIDELQQQIDQLHKGIEDAKKDLESVRSQCATEEARLQGARMFFGAMESLADAAPAAPATPERAKP